MLACVFAGELIAGAALLPAARQPGPQPLVVAGRTIRLENLGGPSTGSLLSRVAADMGPAIDDVVTFWGADWSREISVIATGTDEQFRAAAGGGPASQWTDIAAVTVVERVDIASRTAVGQRIVFAPGAVNMTAAALRIVLSHELFHYAARVDTATDAPRWLTEGVADFVARPRAALPPDAASAAAKLPSDSDLDTPGPQRSLAYDRAWWFTRFVADAYGAAKLRALYLAACGIGHTDVPTAVRDVLGTDPAGLLVGWQRWLDR
nr:hypothetical protein [Mycobacterium kubicae]